MCPQCICVVLCEVSSICEKCGLTGMMNVHAGGCGAIKFTQPCIPDCNKNNICSAENHHWIPTECE